MSETHDLDTHVLDQIRQMQSTGATRRDLVARFGPDVTGSPEYREANRLQRASRLARSRARRAVQDEDRVEVTERSREADQDEDLVITPVAGMEERTEGLETEPVADADRNQQNPKTACLAGNDVHRGPTSMGERGSEEDGQSPETHDGQETSGDRAGHGQTDERTHESSGRPEPRTPAERRLIAARERCHRINAQVRERDRSADLGMSL